MGFIFSVPGPAAVRLLVLFVPMYWTTSSPGASWRRTGEQTVKFNRILNRNRLDSVFLSWSLPEPPLVHNKMNFIVFSQSLQWQGPGVLQHTGHPGVL